MTWEKLPIERPRLILEMKCPSDLENRNRGVTLKNENTQLKFQLLQILDCEGMGTWNFSP